jgi:hypothetical protein
MNRRFGISQNPPSNLNIHVNIMDFGEPWWIRVSFPVRKAHHNTIGYVFLIKADRV